MGKLKTWWYRLFANNLWYDYLDARFETAEWTTRYKRVLSEKADLVREDSKIAAEICNMRNQIRTLEHQDPTAASLDASRHHAAQDRIRSLEGDVKHLEELLEPVRTQLRQELANSYYCDEVMEHFAGDQPQFNNLPEEERQRFFDIVDKKLA